MELMGEYKIKESREDAIRILGSAPIRPDPLPEKSLVQFANRAPIAHLAMEKRLQALIAEGGGRKQKTHARDELIEALRACDRDSVDLLVKAFNLAVEFFRHDACFCEYR